MEKKETKIMKKTRLLTGNTYSNFVKLNKLLNEDCQVIIEKEGGGQIKSFKNEVTLLIFSSVKEAIKSIEENPNIIINTL